MFWKMFFSTNKQMLGFNNSMKLHKDKSLDRIESWPHHWLVMARGIRMCRWGLDDLRHFLIGNPLIWWSANFSVVLLPLYIIIKTIQKKRGGFNFSNEKWDKFLFAAKIGLVGWVLHFLPFLVMGRIMYIHHYFPALYFAMISFATLVDHFASHYSKTIHFSIIFICGAIFTSTFLYFKDFTFGMTGPFENYKQKVWLKSWEFLE